MDEELKRRLDAQDVVLQNIYVSAEKTRKYILATVIVSLIVVVLPLIAALFIVPAVLDSYLGALEGL